MGREGYFSSLHHTRPTPKTTKKESKYEQLAMGDPGADGECGPGRLFLEPPPHSTHPQNYKKKRKEYEQICAIGHG